MPLPQWLAPLGAVGGIVLMASAGIVFKDDIKGLLHAFIHVVDKCEVRFARTVRCLALPVVVSVPCT